MKEKSSSPRDPRSAGTNLSIPQSSAFSSSASTAATGGFSVDSSGWACSSPAMAIGCRRPSWTMLIAASSKPASSVTPSAMSWSAARSTAPGSTPSAVPMGQM